MIGKEIDDRYMEELKKQSIHPEIIKEMAKDIKIVYTPLHGTGNLPVRRVLKELGFEHVYVVPEQENRMVISRPLHTRTRSHQKHLNLH